MNTVTSIQATNLLTAILHDAISCIKRASKSRDLNVLQQAINDWEWINGAPAPISFKELCATLNVDFSIIFPLLPKTSSLLNIRERFVQERLNKPKWTFKFELGE